MANCNDLFQSFHSNIILSISKRNSLKEARDAIRQKIKDSFNNNKRSPCPKFYSQGSFATKTIINPIDGEYDIDDGVYLQHLDKRNNNEWPSPETVHKWILDAVASHTGTPPVDKRTCVRVIYKGDYHVDLPIYCELNKKFMLAEKGKKGWHESDVIAISEWFSKAFGLRGDQLRKMVRIIKAWADYKSRNSILPRGLVLAVLVVECFVAEERDDICLGQLASNIYNRMRCNSCILNPVDPSEDLYSRYDESVKNRFLEFLQKLKNAAQEALAAESKKNACIIWKKEFGQRWPDCEKLHVSTPKGTDKPALLNDDARSA